MADTERARTGTITVEWVAGDDLDDPEGYGWSIRCDPRIPDEVVCLILEDIIKVY